MLYFAYGSNMSSRRLRERIDSPVAQASATLPGHRLAFHKAGRDGSAKCDACVCADVAHPVIGVLFAIDPNDRAVLDHYEGVGSGYAARNVAVTLSNGDTASAFTYYATQIDAALQPFRWYREHVLRGAHEHGLPSSYCDMIAATGVIDDPDPERHQRELAIYL